MHDRRMTPHPAIRDLPVIATAGDAHRLFRPLLHDHRDERAHIAFVDRQRRLIGTTRVRGHSCDAVSLPVRVILTQALSYRATALIVAHNHPGGDPRPSPADHRATRALTLAAGALGIRVLDHLVFGGDGCRSFRRLGLL
jgi:DNA repair protein RadC